MAALGLSVIVVFFVALCLGSCQACGRTILTDLQGTITDGPGGYPDNKLCEWLIKAPRPNVSITLKFLDFGTECSYDYLFIHDGDSYLSPLIGSISGNSSLHTVVSHSGQMLINLYSDTNYSLRGFIANYTIENCTDGCSGKGTCEDGFCQCQKNWRGKACDLHTCPLACNNAESHGNCDFSQGHCVCKNGFIGESCSVSTMTADDSNKWYAISSSSPIFHPRTAHSVVYSEESDVLLSFGGYSLSRVFDDLLQFNFTSIQFYLKLNLIKTPFVFLTGYSLSRVFDDLLQFNFTSSRWSEVQTGSSKPVGRFSHSASLYHDSMVLFGGELENGNLTNELWFYNITLGKWTELAVNDAGKPPRLAEHTGTIVDDELYIFGGRTVTDPFSSTMYSYSLSNHSGWKKVSYNRGNEAKLRMLGHSAVYYADMRSLIIFGGFVPFIPRKSSQSNRLLAFHLDLRVWSSIDVDVNGLVPRGRAFHSAVLIGDYMIIYGGNVHEHYNEEICYDNKALFYNLKCNKWIPASTFDALSPSDGIPQQGRFSHSALLRNGSVMLVTGGFAGLPLGDVLGYKLPVAIAAKSTAGGHCGGHSTQKSCQEDPECGWCSTSTECLSSDLSANCSGILSQGSCREPCTSYSQCSSCLSFGGSQCGWCVQDSRCYPINSPTGACQIVTDSNNREKVRGWWGNEGQFLTSLNQCKTMDFPPGLIVVEYREVPNITFPDAVRIIPESKTEILHLTIRSNHLRARVTEMIGFVYPFKFKTAPWTSYTLSLVLDNIKDTEAKLWLSTDETESKVELVAHCTKSGTQQCTAVARRSNNQPLFPSPSEGKKYYLRVEVDQSVDSSVDSRVTLRWNRTDSLYLTVPITAQFLQPYASSNDNCSAHKTCLACMADASCGWCVTACLSRRAPSGLCQDGVGNLRNITLNVTECTLCSDHVDCQSCVQDGGCKWAKISNTLGCYRKGITDSGNAIQECNSPCPSRKTCSSCVSDDVGCAWCDKTQSCFVFGTYTSRYPFGQCAHWIDSGGQCSNCSQYAACNDCLKDIRCGWCGNDFDPRIGRCFAGGFKSPDNGQCSTLFPTNGSTVWSYSECPDVDECKLGVAQCHPNASCVNLPGSFNCVCNRGFIGDGVTVCNKTCYHDCGDHGVCSADFTCDCNLGWLGENCSIDCGCNGHSDCLKGVGICDKCQDYTYGTHCELCVPGSFGNATTSKGCNPCQCNGHGDPDKYFCDMTTGQCYCTDFTMGFSCDECMQGLLGNPRNGGLCFHECERRSILINITEGFISTEMGAGVQNKMEASCLWVISSLSNSSHDVVYGPSPPPVENRGHITLTFRELRISCLTDHVEVYDGLPPFLLDGSSSVQSFYQLGSFCDWSKNKLRSVTANLGNMVVLVKVDLSSNALSKGFSAKFKVRMCPDLCDGNKKCVMTSHGEQCVCLEGWTGDDCNQQLCPNNCSLSLGQGRCNQIVGSCVCSSGFAGPDCSQVVTPGDGVWEVIGGPHPNSSTNRLARMGHTMVHGPGVLLVYAGYSFTYGLLDDLYSYNLTSNTWSIVEVNRIDATVPSARYLHSAVFHTDAMLIYGGETDNGTDDSLWSFNTTTLSWNKLTSRGPKVAGQTTTLVGDDIYIIGGYDPIMGFSERLYKYNVITKAWTNLATSGPSPKGVYGHSALLYTTSSKSFILVFGGYRFRVHSVDASDELYSFDLTSKKWSILQPLPSNEPSPKYFHSAVIRDDVMLVYGGRSNTSHQFFSRQLWLYNVKCNYWHLLSEKNLVGSKPDGLLSAAMVQIAGKFYLFGGFHGQTQPDLFRLTLPIDLCQGYTSKENCTAVKTCSWCELQNVTQGGNDTLLTNNSACYSVTSPLPAICHAEANVTQVTLYNGTDCSDPTDRVCSSFFSCSKCLASSIYTNLNPSCKWCVGCNKGGKCIESSEDCNDAHPCAGHSQHALLNSDVCVPNNCEATSCSACIDLQNQCVWTPQLKWQSEVRLTFSNNPYTFSWNCWGNLRPEDIEVIGIRAVKTSSCPQPCTAHNNCTACLFSSGADGAWKECVWSETLGKCFSPSALPLICLAGRCGRVLRGSSANCMGNCIDNSQCSSCLSSYYCGWCGEYGTTGEGKCFEGGLQGPLRSSCPGRNASNYVSQVWASTLCPLENECLNERHTCDRTTQDCVDLPEEFKCVCKAGYNDTGNPGTCLPVCSQGCLQGRCAKPDKCECNFGWTSIDCSVKCLCNEHGQCANETHLDVCHSCQNHTTGQSCEFCKPLYVGDARNNGSCVSCYDACNHRAHVCMSKTDLEHGRNLSWSFNESKVKEWLDHGPYKIEYDEECLCQNNSEGLRCDLCVTGFFNRKGDCVRCLCNGHADSCHVDGKCSCSNNTMEDCQNAEDCYKNQCVKCKETFMGNPVDNQQCYRKISVMKEFVIGKKTSETSQNTVEPLPYGQAIFYAIYPRFTNVDIRLTIDVFEGSVDVFVADENNEFTVTLNETSGHHRVNVKSVASSRRKRRASEEDGVDSYSSNDKVAVVVASNTRLNTFVSYQENHNALVIRDVRKRLVLTFPHLSHYLRDTRFYMVFVGRDRSGTRGQVYFRQDLSQIDLFVFFSVFFSAFFLVVSVSVFGWKIKQYHTRRRVIEVREHQLETMRSRPFATYSFLCQMKKPQPSLWRVKRDIATLILRDSSSVKDNHLRLRDVKDRPVISPVCQENTEDGRATVTTVVFQLPGNECSDFQLMLGSTLSVVTNQHSVRGEHHRRDGRTFGPRRTVTFTS
ncbi:multiple epidermal growth factor-like domains protein 8 [Stylophora pistillata]|uniref:multiple epidermal growth factor-like domains protein 8 n=1 Tax=Stylophora pistillata TaxID=50429 RepID=UPI000C04911B|nr:multiple epidermal growth factor-like domains protein 8 [Stylophora pistillata]